jgi:UDPglucose 6-dehydrogenase
MKHITVIGTSYVGLTTAACFADMGHAVCCIDIDECKIGLLATGIMPIHEPGLAEVVIRNTAHGRLSFTTSYARGIPGAEFVFIAVGTPDDGNGAADLSQVRAAAKSIAEHLTQPVIVVNKSTVPIGTGDLVASIIREHRHSDVSFAVVSNPEFLREGSALADCMHPDRVVLGADDREAAEQVAALYAPLKCPVIITDLRTAEMIKYASNAFLATRISFINEIAGICEQLGADVKDVALGMGYDKRIGPHVLDAGLGFGGSCLPKDVKALMHMGGAAGQHPQLLAAVMEINADRRHWAVTRLRERLGDLSGRRIALLGLAFKPDTDDVREAASLDLIRLLRREGAEITAYDPEAMENARAVTRDVSFSPDAYTAVDGADAIILVTEWNEFKSLDLAELKRRMRGNVFIDGRNFYEPEELRAVGFRYAMPGRQEIPPLVRTRREPQPAHLAVAAGG